MAARSSPRLASLSLGVLGASIPTGAYAGPGGGPLINFGQSILNFLTGLLAYVVVGVGVCIAAISVVMGNREGY